MAQRSNMFYAYFRFYVNESEIITGMNKFCTGWENMFAVGYNYKEFKCFVDDLGGFEHWVGDMRGYISQTRETGFLDGAPSDGVFDQTLLMGSDRITLNKFEVLNGCGVSTQCLLRKLTGKDAGTDHKIDVSFATSQKINHPMMYTIDSNQIEILEIGDTGITDNSNVDEYEGMVDINKTVLKGILHTTSGLTVTNFDNMFDNDCSTFCQLHTVYGTGYIIIEMPSQFTSIGIQLYDYAIWADGKATLTKIYVSDDAIAWTLVGTIPVHDQMTVISDVSVASSKYVKIFLDWTLAGAVRADIYLNVCS